MHAYQYIVEALGLDEGEIFNMYMEVPCVNEKDAFCLDFIKTLTDPKFETGTEESDRRLLKSLIAFAMIMEGLFFLCRLCASIGAWPTKQNARLC